MFRNKGSRRARYRQRVTIYRARCGAFCRATFITRAWRRARFDGKKKNAEFIRAARDDETRYASR